jgi:hypothetical protein
MRELYGPISVQPEILNLFVGELSLWTKKKGHKPLLNFFHVK